MSSHDDPEERIRETGTLAERPVGRIDAELDRDGAVITVEAADAISTSGFDNRVTYRSGSPDIENAGGSNVVEQG